MILCTSTIPFHFPFHRSIPYSSPAIIETWPCPSSDIETHTLPGGIDWTLASIIWSLLLCSYCSTYYPPMGGRLSASWKRALGGTRCSICPPRNFSCMYVGLLACLWLIVLTSTENLNLTNGYKGTHTFQICVCTKAQCKLTWRTPPPNFTLMDLLNATEDSSLCNSMPAGQAR